MELLTEQHWNCTKSELQFLLPVFWEIRNEKVRNAVVEVKKNNYLSKKINLL